MRRSLVLVLLLVAACSEPAATPRPTGSAPATTVPPTEAAVDTGVTTTAEPETTTTTAASTSTSSPTTSASTLPPLAGLEYRPLVTGVPFPTVSTSRPGETDSVVATKSGGVHRLVDGELETILDISGRLSDDGERGLLGLAFHPEDPDRMFLHHTDGAGDTVVAEYALDGWEVDPDPVRVLLTVDQPAANHNGGMIQFGPDGALFVGLGDGGGGGDQFGNGQRQDTLLAGLVRIDVDSGDATKFASGLRNPWRFWIDGDRVFVADVGQGSYEEVTVAPLEEGVNYGWPITEGLHCYQPPSGCDTGGLTLPLVEVEHGDAGTCSIAGGVVYRGPSIPELDGQFLFSDYCGGYLRSVDEQGETTDWTEQVGVPGSVVSFGVDAPGEVHVLTTDAVLALVPIR